MDLQRYDSLITSLEQKAQQDPRAYLNKVIAVALLGFVVLAAAMLVALSPLLLLAGMVWLTIITKGKAAFVLLKLGKLIILLLIPAWYMIKASIQMLFARFPTPAGHEINAKDAPRLFSRIKALRKKMHGPPIHHVLITDEVNAAIVQHPKLGLFGWERNYLILGLPLMQATSEEETLAVIAHEYGHLSGHHSRLGGFIYRLRSTWGRLQDISESWQDWGSQLIAKLFRWYAPYFNAYTFVFARQNEYVADKNSVELVGAKHTANALIRINVAAQFEHDEFWLAVDKIAGQHAEPLPCKSEFWATSLRTQLDDAKRAMYLEKAGKVKTDHHDTHPAISDRLQAIGADLQQTPIANLAPPAHSAAEVLLGTSLKKLSAQLDTEWKKNVSQRWQERHAYLKERKQEFAELEVKPELNEQEAWDKVVLTEELAPQTPILPMVQAFLAQYPQHLRARYRRGVLLLEEDNEAGIEDLEYVMSSEKDATLSCCEAAWHFYLDKDKTKAQNYLDRWNERNDFLMEVQYEVASIPPGAKIVEHDLPADIEADIIEIATGNTQYIKRMYLVRRIIQADPEVRAYVLGFEEKWLSFDIKSWSLRNKDEIILDNLAQHEYPVTLHIVNLKHSAYGKHRETIKHLGIRPIYEA